MGVMPAKIKVHPFLKNIVLLFLGYFQVVLNQLGQ